MENLVKPVAQGFGVEAAELLRGEVAGTGFPVVDKYRERLAFDVERDLEDVARSGRGVAARFFDREFAEDRVLVALFMDAASLDRERREVGLIRADRHMVALESLVIEVLEQQCLDGQAADLVVEAGGEHFLDGRVFVFGEKSVVVGHLAARREIQLELVEARDFRPLASVERLEHASDRPQFLTQFRGAVGVGVAGFLVVLENRHLVRVEKVLDVVSQDAEFPRMEGGRCKKRRELDSGDARMKSHGCATMMQAFGRWKEKSRPARDAGRDGRERNPGQRSAAWAAARRATGTRNGEQLT